MEWRPPALCVLVLAFSWGLQVNAIRVRRSNHVDNVCSMWGNFHFKTFDGDIYQFQGICEYNLVSHCHGPVQDFSVHVKRAEFPGDSKITRVLVTIGDMAIELTKNLVMVNSDIVKLPHYVAGVLLEQYATYIKLYAKLGLSVMWNRDDAVMVELDSKYTNHTCGLCGDFNGMLILNEFISEAREIDPVEFGNKQRVHNPNSLCEDLHEEDEPITMGKCQAFRPGCSELLEDKAWSSCTNIVSPEPYIQACVMDRCWSLPGDIEDSQSMCSTLSEYSRQCSHAGGMPPNWRKPDFCAVKCPYNMEYSESGSPCVDTCSHRDTSLLCEEHKMDGCFCPPGTVFDDISDRGCIPQEQCQCKHNKVYNSGDVLQMEGKECVCHHGSWTCESLPTPGLCAVEEGSHFMTFDGKEFTFHGDCYYVLSQDCMESAFTVLGQLIPCVDQETDTCLKSVVLLPNNDKNNALIIKDDGTVRQNGDLTLPYASANLMVFRPSSFHIIVHTSFGLQMQVQLVPIMQLYITLDKSYQTKTCGLCGNFNMVLSDELKTPQGLVEGTAASFANSWKAQATCPDRSERLDDPCSYNIDSESYAEHWCSKLKEKEGQFAKCHSSVNPESYYKRCKYSTCTCEKTENCLCAVFSSYVRACTAKGIFLQDWRDTVCEKYTGHCPATQTFSYLLQGCQRTCDSLSSERQACINDYVPVDGCACPDGLYENENGVCVALDKCSCYHNGEHIKPGKSITIKNEHCVCTNGNLHCHSWKPLVTECQAPKVFFNCSESGPDEHGLECAQTCAQRNVDCYLAGCTSGCQCPSGLLDDGRGHCVPQHNCPCKHNDHYYLSGSKITVQCNTCTCKQGTWKCTDKKCPGTCTIYGSGHYNTFDDQRFGFSGDCGYIAVQNKCGNKTGTFHVITENVPCGTTGTTCSKSVRIVLGKTQLDLIDGKVTNTDLDTGTLIKHRVRNVGLYLAIEADIGLTVLWDRKTTVRIILQPQHMGEVCGLCGNYNENGKDDFTTQGQLQVSDVLEFANSWKVNSHCPDADPDFDPCSKAQNRHTWAKMQCSIITGETFKDCHRMVDPAPYFDNCVRDSCACDTGGDCECFCTAVGAYAQACNEAGVCVAWRTPEICPVFCEYYNDPLECLWHYSPCHTPCYKTCLNPDGICRSPLPNLEGCYPKCPEDKPIFDEEKQICVEKCEGCFINGTEYETGEEIPSDKPCTLCLCDESGWETCSPREGCCFYNETEYGDYDVIYNVTDNMGMCYYAICINSTVIETSKPCPTPTPPTSEPTTTFTTSTTGESTTQFIVTTTTAIPTSTSQSQPTPTVSQETTECIICDWTEWFNVYDPSTGNGNDLELYKNIHDAGKTICETPEDIECRAISNPDISFDEFVQQTGQIVQCNVSIGLVCEKDHQNVRPFKCINYEIRVLCCGPCESTPSPTTIMTTPKETTTSETTPHPGSEGTTSTSTPTTTPETEQTTTSLTTTKATTTEVIVEQTTLPPETTPSSKPITTTTTTTEVTHVSTTTPETEQTPSPTTSTTTATIPTETTTSTITTEPTTHVPTVVTAEIITKSPQTEPQIEITTEQTSTTVRTTKATTTSEVIVVPTTPYPETEETTPTSIPTATTTTTKVPHVSTTTPETEQTTTTGTTTKATTTSEVTVEPTTPYPGTEGTTATSKPTTTTTTTEVPHVSTTTPETEQTTTAGTTIKATTTSKVTVEPTTPYPGTEETTPTSTPTTTTTTKEVPHVSTTTPETEQTTTTGTTTIASTITSEVTVEPTTPYPETEETTPTSTSTTTTTTTEVPHVSTTTPETEQTTTTGTTTKETITSEVIVESTTPYPETEETTPMSKPTTTTTTTEVPHFSTTTPESEQTTTTGTTTKEPITSEVIVEPTTPYPGTEGTTPTSTPTTTTTTTEVPHVSTTTPETEQPTTTETTNKASTITSEVTVEPTTPYPGTEGTTPTSTPTTTTTTTEVPHVSTTTPETEQTTTTGTTTKASTITSEVIVEPTTPYPETEETTPTSKPITTTTTTEVPHVSTTTPETEQPTTTETTTKASTITSEVIVEPTTPYPGTEETTPTSKPTTTTTTIEVPHVSTTTPETEQTTTTGTTTKEPITPEVTVEPTTPYPGTEGTTPTSKPTTTTTTTEVPHVSTTTPETEQPTTTGTTTKASTITSEVIVESTTPYPETEETTPMSKPTTTTTTTEVPHVSTPTPESEQTTTTGTTTKEPITSEVIVEPTTPYPGTEGTTPTSKPTTTTTTIEVPHVSTTTPETEQITTTGTTTKASTITSEVIVEPTKPYPETEETTPTSKPTTTTTTTEVPHVSTTTPETEQPTTTETTTKASTITSEVTVEPTTPYPGTEGTTPTSTPTTTTTTTEVPHVSTTTPETEQTTTTGTTTKEPITSEVIVEPTTRYPETEGTTPTSKPTTTTTTTEVPYVSTTTPETEQPITTETTTKASTITSEVIVEPTTPYPETEETTPTSKPTTTTTTTEVPHVSTTTPETEQPTTTETTTKASTITSEVTVEPTTPYPGTEETTPTSKPTTTTTTTEVPHVSTTTPETEQPTTTETTTKASTITSEVTVEPTTPYPGTEETTPTSKPTTTTTTTEVPHVSTTTPETEQPTTTGTTTKASTITSEVTVEPTKPYPGTEETTPTSKPTTTTTTTEVPHVSTTTPETEQPITTETTTKASTITSEVIVEPTTPYPETEETTPTSTPTTTTTTTEVPHVSTTTPETEQPITTETTTKASTITSEVTVEPTTPYPGTEETTPTSTPTVITTTTEMPHVSTTTPETEQPTTTETTTKASTITSEVTVEPTTLYPGTEETTPTSKPTTTTTTTEVPHVSTTTPETEQPITTETTTKASTITSEVTVEPTTPYPGTEETTPTSTPTVITTTTEVPHVSTTTPETEKTPSSTTSTTIVTMPIETATSTITTTTEPTTSIPTVVTAEIITRSPQTEPQVEITTEHTSATSKATTTPEIIVKPTTHHPKPTPLSTPTTTTKTTTQVTHVSTTTPETEQTTASPTTTKATTTREVIVEQTTSHPGTTPVSTPTTTTEVSHVSTTTLETKQTSTTVTTTKETSTTEVIGAQTTPPLKTTPLSTPTTTTTGTSTSTRIPSTTVCVCVINGKHYEPGETIFDMIHIGSGICLTMICSNICEIKNKTQPCPTTTSPPLTTPKFDCPEWDVNQNETFEICNCTMARCIEDNIIEIIPYECPPIENITCSNGKKPVLVPDENYCCEEYACDCFCEGWGDPHYITFDGLFYSHQGNCTYVLMEEISPKHNLKIYIDNVNCDPREFVSCPRALIVSYNNVVITLRNNNLIGAAKLEALLGHTTMKLPFTKNGVQVLGSGVNMILEIPQLGVVLTFGVTGFSVNLPFRHFGENTQGHCGTCNNNKKDDCMLPGGKLIDDCAVMADYWPAKDLYNPDCPQPPTVPPTSAPTKKPCPTNPVCELLKTDLFKECHPFISPDNYFTGCQFDSCHVTNPAVVCTSLQTYASACSQFGVCLHWRNHTNICTVTCEGDKVYKPCGPAEPPTCHDRPNGMSMNVTTEGCFCPDGTMLFNKDSGVCVDKCGCLDPSGQARELGEKFQHNCQDCLCEATTASVTCQPKQCSNDNPVICSEPGFIVVNETDPTDECCTIFTCRCDSTFCPNIDGKCEIGYGPVLTVPEGKCCPELICEPKKVCVHKNIEYEPGTTTPVVDCQECHCTSEVDPKSQLYKVRCGMVACNEDCEPGYKYMEPLGEECCGKCVQTKCVISHNGTRHVLQDGEEWVPKKPGCDKFICVNVAGEYITTNYKIQCPPFNIDDCQPGTMQLSADGCCQVCVEKEQGCKVETTFDYITDNDCWSEKRVEQTFCEGNCNSYSKYSELGSSSCGCCQASRTSNRTVTLNCANGNSVQHTYIQVEECSCNQTECHATLSAETKN